MPKFKRTAVASTVQPHCDNPFNVDPESYTCACHKVMLEEMEARGVHDLTSPEWSAFYRSQLCHNPTMCNSWKKEACCTNYDNALNEELSERMKASVGLYANKRWTCQAVEAECQPKAECECKSKNECDLKGSRCRDIREIHAIVRLNCPKTCGMCIGAPHLQADLDLDDIISSKETRLNAWTLTPVPPAWTHSPTTDQSCFTSPDDFDCRCHTFKQRHCKKEDFRRQLTQGSVSSCEHFFVCTHSNTCKSYKDKHCHNEIKLLKTLQNKGVHVATC